MLSYVVLIKVFQRISKNHVSKMGIWESVENHVSVDKFFCNTIFMDFYCRKGISGSALPYRRSVPTVSILLVLKVLKNSVEMRLVMHANTNLVAGKHSHLTDFGITRSLFSNQEWSSFNIRKLNVSVDEIDFGWCKRTDVQTGQEGSHSFPDW